MQFPVENGQIIECTYVCIGLFKALNEPQVKLRAEMTVYETGFGEKVVHVILHWRVTCIHSQIPTRPYVLTLVCMYVPMYGSVRGRETTYVRIRTYVCIIYVHTYIHTYIRKFDRVYPISYIQNFHCFHCI